MEDADVLIVGAGPSGLALAAELKRLGVSATTIDKQAAGANTSSVAVVHADTLEVLEFIGVTAGLLTAGLKVPIFRVRDHDRTLTTVDFSGLPTTYPFALTCPQDRTEAILLQTLETLDPPPDPHSDAALSPREKAIPTPRWPS